MAPRPDSSRRAPIAYGLLRAYKATLSPVFYVLGARCRHEPTCSVYMADCAAGHGAWAGIWMGLARLSRCRPGGSSGWDPAPEECPHGHPLLPWRYGDWSSTHRPFPQDEVERAPKADTETNP